MKCKICGRNLPESAKFCLECGQKVERDLICPSCGTVLPPDAKFCLECGTSVIAAADKDKEEIVRTNGFTKEEPDDTETVRNGDEISQASGTGQPEAEEYKGLNAKTDGSSSEMHRKLSELKENANVDTEEGVRQFIRNYLRIIGYTEVKYLGGGCFYLYNPECPATYIWHKFAILNLNPIGDFMKRDYKGFREFYNRLSYHHDSWLSHHHDELNTLYINNIFICDQEAYHWCSKPVDEKLYCLKYLKNNYSSSIDNSYRYRLDILDLHAADSYKDKKMTEDCNATIKVLAYTSGEKRILINAHEYGFFIFDPEGNSILKKEGNYYMRESHWGYMLLEDRNNSEEYVGLYDEINGTQLRPCLYQNICMWRKMEKDNKKARNNKNREIILQGVLKDRGSGFQLENQCHYDPQTRRVSVFVDTSSLPNIRTNYEDLKKMEYENLFYTDTTISEPTTLEPMIPEDAK